MTWLELFPRILSLFYRYEQFLRGPMETPIPLFHFNLRVRYIPRSFCIGVIIVSSMDFQNLFFGNRHIQQWAFATLIWSTFLKENVSANEKIKE